jgi:ABC-type multidrug transport system ATPase subunit
MNIKLEGIGKRYNYEWIFRKLDYEFTVKEPVVILGSNGSGKSTLLQILTGRSLQSEGTIKWYDDRGPEIDSEVIFKHVVIAAPYQELIEEFTLQECLDFHFSLKQPINSLKPAEIIEILQLERAKRKPVRYFSSGMKQRLKLGLAILSVADILLLDEPCSNLDQAGMNWYANMVEKFGKDRLIVVASNNQSNEYSFCTRKLNINDYKTF